MNSLKKNIFVTGISGSVGHYFLDLLGNHPEYQLFLLLRNPQKLKRDLSKYNNVTIIKDELQTVHKQKAILKQMDYAVLIATSWGGFKEPWRVNVYATCRILRAFDPLRIKKIVYFSTASILDRNHKPVEAIRTIGTNYIRSKFLMHKMLPKLPLYKKIVTVFPTWVYGGGQNYPFSHAAVGLPNLKKLSGLAKWFTFDFAFHFIHCADIALMTKYILEHEMPKNEYVLGNKPLEIGEFFIQAAEYCGQKRPKYQISIPMGLIRFLAKLKGSHSWDMYCLNYKHFVYETLSCAKLGLPSEVDTVAGLLKSIE